MRTSVVLSFLAASSVLAAPALNKRTSILSSIEPSTLSVETSTSTASSAVETSTADEPSATVTSDAPSSTATSDAETSTATASSSTETSSAASSSSEFSSSSSTASSSSTSTSTSSSASASATSTTASTVASYGTFAYKGCYSGTTKTGGRTIKNLITHDSWTVESCLAAVDASEYAVGGLTYGGECWGSNTVPASTLAVDASKCSWACNDASSEICGGQTALSVYVSTQTSKLIDDDNWSYTGCYSDNVNGVRTLPNLENIGGKWTVQACLAAVKNARLSVGGLEYGGECWGATEINGNAPKHSSTSCNMACNDDASLSCGGNYLLDIYTLKTSNTKAVDEDWSYKGCYTDSISARSLSTLITTNIWSASDCLDAALAADYAMAGLIYGGECWAGNSLASSASKLTGSRCAWSCNDASTETCGGEAGLDVYYRS